FSQVMKDAEAHMINLQFANDLNSGFNLEGIDENLSNTTLQKSSHVNSMSMSVNKGHRLSIFKALSTSGELSDQTSLFINQNNGII
ncbi:DNA repair protein, partial [Legionella pneumophila]